MFDGDQAFIEYIYINCVFDLTQKIINKEQSIEDLHQTALQHIQLHEVNKEEEFENLDYFIISARSEKFDSIYWYTKDSFVYRMTNRILRQQNLVTIFKIRYFINELRGKIKSLSQNNSNIKTLYRGTIIPEKEYINIEKNLLKPFLLNGFLSTTKLLYNAESFLAENKEETEMSFLNLRWKVRK